MGDRCRKQEYMRDRCENKEYMRDRCENWRDRSDIMDRNGGPYEPGLQAFR
jgi:hypothetical protein